MFHDQHIFPAKGLQRLKCKAWKETLFVISIGKK
ncbi:uncharacterized protein METZ01_LOCUS433903 [marine metagenome]|uniref:Uncharacterized protein n=1 Tax=marine metagenome TaxID=408172 RepID=A0A382YDH9_9ZZZZ